MILRPCVHVFAAALLISTASFLGAQQRGSATFNDNAPPVTDQQRKDAVAANDKAVKLRDALSSLGRALRATKELQRAFAAKNDKVALDAIGKNKLDTWIKLAKNVGKTSNDTVTLDEPSLAAYPKAALDAAIAISNAPASASSAPNIFAADQTLARSTVELLARAYDVNLYEHGTVNRTLRVFPYAAVITQQPFIECDVMNVFSRDLKCLPPRSQGVLTNKDWLLTPTVNLVEFCHTEEIEPFGRADYGKRQMYVRKHSTFADKLGAACAN
jgi:hypothetical protein